MKKFNIKLLFVLLASCFMACDEFLDVNSNPNSPIGDNLPLSAKLPGALVSITNQEVLQLNQIGAFWGGYWGTNNEGINQFFDLKTYNGQNIRSQREGIPVWENGYNNILYFRLIQDEAESTGQLFYAGTSKIMQGMMFLRLVDMYNNIPFDDAAKGSEVINPAYESGQVVYQKAVNLISEGIEDVKASGTIPSNHGDVLFQGNKSLWAKFGNTLKLRALIRQSEKNETQYVNAEIQKIITEGSGFLMAGELAAVNPGYMNTNGKMNPFWAAYYRDVQGNTTANYQSIRPTIYLLEQYQSKNDPRLERLYVPVEGSYRGVIFGNSEAGNPIYERNTTSAFRGPSENNNQATGIFHNWNQSSVILSDFESLFLQAEAVHRGWIAGDVSQLYQQAIARSFDYTKVPEASLSGYLAQSAVALADAQNPLERIIEQKWLALNSISSIEAWNDFRRLGVPNYPATAASGITGRPLRLMYPETERGTNLEQVEAQGSDRMLQDKVWWMP
ncbi:SusD/RagB family nutrient-binding outer membrane lipoprotein [Belliella sp. DSM 111904]|uniref:SusD/RagB family nutrient-binding outer membrane lipoprotein n=1 Tax=Belliella filtrata TaxID=2923435 RepID=A0ABS9V029_9BACT|nr:SusD/RagB family nutrient-binding outer membrane lipoprotein [Belliella filtrata]MCH7409771.1 SusD/RagB family nutrient-binding outer membrane lipoprotein [Belliella filtrata]